MKFNFKKYKSPLGNIYIVAEGKDLRAMCFAKNWPEIKERFSDLTEENSPIIKKAVKQLQEYFSGKRRSFELNYKLDGTSFQKKTWLALKKIPFGKTQSYGEQARSMKSPKSARAVGRTNGLNPLCIVLPCHRVICSDGSISGYAGGVKVKRSLLRLEEKRDC